MVCPGNTQSDRGGSRISGKGFICIIVCDGGRFADFVSFFLNIP